MTRATGIGPLPDLLKAWEGEKTLRTVFADAHLPLAVIHDRTHRIPLAALARLYQAAAERTPDATFGLTAGMAMSPTEYGKWISYAGQASTLADGISRIIRTLHFHQDGTQMRLAPRPEGQVAWEYWHPDVSSVLFRQHSDHIVPGMIRFTQLFLGQDWRPSRVEAAYATPRQTETLEAETQTPWLFECPCLAIVMPATDLHIARANAAQAPHKPPLLTYMDVAADLRSDWPDTAVNNIAAIIALRLLDGEFDIEGAAQMLGTGCRTLQRRLTDQGLSYRTLVTHIRMERARNLIKETAAPLKGVSAETGYSDPAHFARAFRKHYGYPPSQVQKRVSSA